VPLLTTSKILAVFDKFASNARTRLLGLLEAVEANTTANESYQASCTSKGYDAVRSAMLADAESAAKGKTAKNGGFSREIDTLKAGSLTLQQNQAYYLIKGFTSSVGNSPYHIRFENPGQEEIDSFHLTTEEGWTQVNLGGGLWAKGRFFFTIEKGVIIPQVKNQIRGHGIDQASDMRLAPLVLDTMIYVYYLMYCLSSI
jgi:hypothetical protein